jgi:hypothetical protein
VFTMCKDFHDFALSFSYQACIPTCFNTVAAHAAVTMTNDPHACSFQTHLLMRACAAGSWTNSSKAAAASIRVHLCPESLMVQVLLRFCEGRRVSLQEELQEVKRQLQVHQQKQHDAQMSLIHYKNAVSHVRVCCASVQALQMCWEPAQTASTAAHGSSCAAICKVIWTNSD